MKKKLVAVAAACVLAMGAFAVSGCSSSNGSSSSNSSSNYTLVVGFDQNYPPYGFVASDGTYTGFDLDLATAVAEDNGWNIECTPIDWDAKDALLNGGNISCIWNGFTYEGRENDYTWSDSYMLNEQVIVVKAGSGITSEADLAGKVVMTQVDSGALEVLEGDKADLAATFSSLSTIGDYNTAFMQLESGTVDAVACDLSIFEYQNSANPGVYQNIITLSSEHYAVGFKKGDTETAAAVSASLKKLNENGTVKTLCEKYADYGISYSNWCLK